MYVRLGGDRSIQLSYGGLYRKYSILQGFRIRTIRFFGGERLETYRSNAARRWALTLLYTAIVPVPMSTFAGETTSNVGKNFLRSYAGGMSGRGYHRPCLYYLFRYGGFSASG